MAKMTPVNMSVEDVHAAAGLSGVEMPTRPRPVSSTTGRRSRIGEDDRAVPDQQQRQDAADQLHGFHFGRSWFRS
jgi:hypothetical protein